MSVRTYFDSGGGSPPTFVRLTVTRVRSESMPVARCPHRPDAISRLKGGNGLVSFAHPSGDCLDVAVRGPADRRLSVRFHRHFVEGPVHAVERKRLDGMRDSAHRLSMQRNQVGIAVHEA